MFKLKINTEGAAFDVAPEEELNRMLQEVIDSECIPWGNRGIIKDVNGNTAGMWEFNPGGKV
jgi:hypothetical protein